MSETERNKIAAQIIKADMLGDRDRAASLKRQLEKLKQSSEMINRERPTSRPDHSEPETRASYSQIRNSPWKSRDKPWQDSRVKKFLNSTGSLRQMFESEKKVTASDEAKMYLKTAAKLSLDDMETKHFSEELDDSQRILNKNKRLRTEPKQGSSKSERIDQAPCYRCPERVPRHLIIDNKDGIYMAAIDSKPFLSHMSNITICNEEHTCDSFVAADHRQQSAAENMIGILRELWKAMGYRCIIMETYFRDRRTSKSEHISCGHHFQVHCLPIKEKHFERSRMSFKQALQDCEQEWSMNRKLIATGGHRIQRLLPRGLSYFWVCFDDLSNGFGHVIEQETNFSRFFGFEVLASMLDKDFNPMRLNQREDYDEQFKRCRDLKLLYSGGRCNRDEDDGHGRH